jgi:hypothetical protein
LQEKLLCVLFLFLFLSYGSCPGFPGCGRGGKALQGLEGIVPEVSGFLIGRLSFFHDGNGSAVIARGPSLSLRAEGEAIPFLWLGINAEISVLKKSITSRLPRRKKTLLAMTSKNFSTAG